MTRPLIIGSVGVGIVSGVATIYLIPAKFEILFWAVLIVTVGFAVAKAKDHHFFRNGFSYAMVAGVFITLTHVVLLNDYLAGHADEVNSMQPIIFADSIRLTMIVIAPSYWIVLGLLSGLAAVVWSKFYRPANHFR